MGRVVVTLPFYTDQMLDGLPPSISAVGEFSLVPEVGTLRKLPYGTANHAICHINLEEKEDTPSGRELDICPRTCLRRIVK